MIPEARAALNDVISELQESRIETTSDQDYVISLLKDSIKRIGKLQLPKVA